MKFKSIFIPASLMLVLLVQFLPGIALFASPVGATAINASPAELKVSATDTMAYDFVANYCSATWTSGAGTLPCPGTDGAASGYVLKVTSPQLENGSIDTAPGLVIAPQNVTGGFIQGVYPAYTVQSGDRFQSIVNCAYGASACYVLFRLDYKIGTGPQQTFWHWKERNEGLFYRANLDLSSLAGQSVQFILYMADMPGLGSPSGDRAMWGGAQIVHSTSYPAPAPITSYCDRGTFIGDVTIPDGTTLVAGTPFTKTFRIRNVGTCTWTTSYAMVFVAGDLLGAPSTVINLTSSVAPGQTMDFSINMVAPTTAGHYRSYWRFRNASGQQFGLGSGMVTFFADINVSGSPAVGTTITADNPDPSMPGQSVAVSVKVTGTGATPTGTVAITGADTNCSITLSGGTGTCNVVFNSLGAKTLTATYGGNGTYGASSASASHTVSNVSASTTNITSETPDPSTPGALVAVNVTVTGSGSTPTGTVTLSGADTNCTITLSGGSGSCPVIFNTSGGKTITATYNGNSTFAGSTATASHTVSTGAASSSTTIASDIPDPSVPGQGVVVSVTVGGSSPTPTGVVSITGADNNCSILLSGGSGSCSVVFNSVGSKTLTATYSGDGNFAPSSGTAAHTVGLGSTSTTITGVAPEPSNPGQAVLVSFSVTGGGVTPGGTISVTGADVNCSITLSGGSGSCNVVFNTIGVKSITATYSGDSNYLGSFALQAHTVKNSSTTSITSFVAEPSLPGDAVTVNFTVTGAGAIPNGDGTTTGVTITGQESGCVGLQALVSGTGSCVIHFGTAGTKPITATYSGDPNYTPSTGSANHVVSKAPSVTSVSTALPASSTSNQSVTVTVSVSGAGATATGSVGISLSGGQTSTCTATLDGTGSGHCDVIFTAAGTYTITAIYSGDGTHYPSSQSTFIHTVN
jgi:hypothetical protein